MKFMLRITVLAAVLLLYPLSASAGFVDTSIPLASVTDGSIAWGDYDNDGDMDVAIGGNTGDSPNYNPVAKIYKNNGGGNFTALDVNLLGLKSCYLAWCDYDSDGDLDLSLSGSPDNSYATYIAAIYNNGGNDVFTDIGADLMGGGSLAWGDCDNDGDPDLALASLGTNAALRIYRNDDGTFNNVVFSASATKPLWIDYDGDGDLDLSVGQANSGRLYRNDGQFKFISAAQFSNYVTPEAWGDYDNDGDMDCTVTLLAGLPVRKKIYKNTGGIFSDSGIFETPDSSPGEWGDFDNDGDLDLATAYRIYRNDGGTAFVDSGAVFNLGPIHACADYDGDGDLDIMSTGKDSSSTRLTKIWLNDGIITNTRPSAPTNLSVTTNDTEIRFTWNAGSDQQTPVTGLYYNLRIGGSPGNEYLFPSMSDTSTGLRRIPSFGTLHTTSWTLKGPANLPKQLHWSAQSLDTAFAGSGWANEQIVELTEISGNIHAASGDALQGVVVTADNGGWYAVTDANGNYALHVPPGWSGTVTPSKTFWAFLPPSRPYTSLSADQTGQDYTAIPYPRISGQIQSSTGVNLADVQLAVTGQSSVTTDENGCYELRVPPGWTGTVIPAKNNYYFTPAKRTYSDVTEDFLNQDFSGAEMVETAAGFMNVTQSSLSWGDYDNDGDLDLALMGATAPTTGYYSIIYRNDGAGGFTDIGAGLTAVGTGSVAWGDYDNDGDLDLIVTGRSTGTNAIPASTKLYRNDGNDTFNETPTTLPNIYGTVAWADYDNDGDLDLAMVGITFNSGGSSSRIYKVFRNDGNGTFVDSGSLLHSPTTPSMAWADYDNDGYMDLILSDSNIYSSGVTRLYRNDGKGKLVNSAITFPGFGGGQVAWGDYDNDGDPDLACCGKSSSKIFRNNGGTFTDIGVVLTDHVSMGAWGDFDNDGNVDLILSGSDAFSSFTKIYRNDGAGVFSDAISGLQGGSSGCIAPGDYDNDGDMDIVVSGDVISGYPQHAASTRLYRNDGNIFNTQPLAPTGLSAAYSGDTITFNWQPGSDGQTPAAGLSYNIRVGTQPGAADVFSCMANTSTGYRKIVNHGNAQQRLSWTLKGLQPSSRVYYWSVQSIDSLFTGSQWAGEQAAGVGNLPVQVKGFEDNADVACGDVIVTAAYPGAFYIERPDRSSGIRVQKQDSIPTAGTLVTVAGKMGTTQDGERFVDASTVLSGVSASITPILMNSSSLGGGACGLQQATWEWEWVRHDGQTPSYLHEFQESDGLNNIGLLVTVCGRVTQVDEQGRYFYLDDGAQCEDGTLTGVEKDIGVRVAADGRTYQDQYLSITGISSCFKGSDGKVRRMLLIRDQASIRVF